MPASPIASNYLLNERWAPLEVYGTRAPLRRKLDGQRKQIVTAKWLENEQSCEGFWTRTSQQPLTFSYRRWSYFKQSLMPHQLIPRCIESIRVWAAAQVAQAFFFSHSVYRAVRNSPLLLAMFAKGWAFTGIGNPLEADPLSDTNYVVSFEGVMIAMTYL